MSGQGAARDRASHPTPTAWALGLTALYADSRCTFLVPLHAHTHTLPSRSQAPVR